MGRYTKSSSAQFTVQLGPRTPGAKLKNGDTDGYFWVRLQLATVEWLGPFANAASAKIAARKFMQHQETVPIADNFSVGWGLRYWMLPAKKWYLRTEAGELDLELPNDPYQDDNLLGCTDPAAANYDPNATQDDGSCVYVTYGCTDPNALNFSFRASRDDGSCVYPKPGCTDSSALNYDASAVVDDGSCTYSGPQPVVTVAPSVIDIGAVLLSNNANANLRRPNAPQYYGGSFVDVVKDRAGNNNTINGKSLFPNPASKGFYWVEKQDGFGPYSVKEVILDFPDPTFYVQHPDPDYDALHAGDMFATNFVGLRIRLKSSSLTVVRHTPVYSISDVVSYHGDYDNPTVIPTEWISDWTWRELNNGTATGGGINGTGPTIDIDPDSYNSFAIQAARNGGIAYASGTVPFPPITRGEKDTFNWVTANFEIVSVYRQAEVANATGLSARYSEWTSAPAEVQFVSASSLVCPTTFNGDPAFTLPPFTTQEDPAHNQPRTQNNPPGSWYYCDSYDAGGNLIRKDTDYSVRYISTGYGVIALATFPSCGNGPGLIVGGSGHTFDFNQGQGVLLTAAGNNLSSGLDPTLWLDNSVFTNYEGGFVYPDYEGGGGETLHDSAVWPTGGGSLTAGPTGNPSSIWIFPVTDWMGSSRFICQPFLRDGILPYVYICDGGPSWSISQIYGTVTGEGFQPPEPPVSGTGSKTTLPISPPVLFGGTMQIWRPTASDNGGSIFDNNVYPDLFDGSGHWRTVLDDGSVCYLGIGAQSDDYPFATPPPKGRVGLVLKTVSFPAMIPRGQALIGFDTFDTTSNDALVIAGGMHLANGPEKVYTNTDEIVKYTSGALLGYGASHPDPGQNLTVGVTDGPEVGKLGTVRLMVNGTDEISVTIYSKPQQKKV